MAETSKQQQQGGGGAGAGAASGAPGSSPSANVYIKNVDMSEDLQSDIIDLAKQALQKHTLERDIAAHIKKECDRKYGPAWQCVVGRNYGSYVSHETRYFIYFYVGQIAVLLFKT